MKKYMYFVITQNTRVGKTSLSLTLGTRVRFLVVVALRRLQPLEKRCSRSLLVCMAQCQVDRIFAPRAREALSLQDRGILGLYPQ